MKTSIKKGDTVIVIAGKDKDKRGKVLRVLPKKERVVVEGINKIKRHTRPRGPSKVGGIIEKEAPIHISNVMIFCEKCNRGVRIGKRFLENETKVRVCKRCDTVLD